MPECERNEYVNDRRDNTTHLNLVQLLEHDVAQSVYLLLCGAVA